MGLIDFIMMLNAAAIGAAQPPGTSAWDDTEDWDDTEQWIDDPLI